MVSLRDIDVGLFPALLEEGDRGKKRPSKTNALTKFPANTRWSIVVGLGGMGVDTVDRIKGRLNLLYGATWKNYVAFVAIDSDKTSLEKANYLRPAEDELICTTLPGVEKRIRHPEPTGAWRFFVDPEKEQVVREIQSEGTGGSRYVGKIKTYDTGWDHNSVDLRIKRAFNVIRGRKLAPTGGIWENIDVYVIGSSCGGTGGGMFTEMPPMIQAGLGGVKARIFGFLYLPDTMESLLPMEKKNLRATGYATLKELDYYLSGSMRHGYDNWFPSNDPVVGMYHVNADSEFYDIPFLVGAADSRDRNSREIACNKTADFILTVLGQGANNDGLAVSEVLLANHFGRKQFKKVNPTDPHREESREHHEFVKQYSALGYSKLELPQQIVEAYTIGMISEKAGFVFSQDRGAEESRGRLPGFTLPVNTLQQSLEGQKLAEKILEPLRDFFDQFYHSGFSMGSHMGCTSVTFNDIRRGVYEVAHYNSMVEQYIAHVTSPDVMEKQELALKNAMSQVRENIRQFVLKEGPAAYYNLYRGNFCDNADGVGLKAMLDHMVAGGHPITGECYKGASSEEAERALMIQKEVIMRMPTGVFGLIRGNGERITAAAQWVNFYNKWVNARVAEERRALFGGEKGKFVSLILKPQEVLAENIKTFAHVLEVITLLYQKKGAPLASRKALSLACTGTEDSPVWDEESFRVLQQKVYEKISSVNSEAFRKAVLEDFFGVDEAGCPNQALWLQLPDAFIKVDENGIVQPVAGEESAPARERFDNIVDKLLREWITVSFDEFCHRLLCDKQDEENNAYRLVENLIKDSEILLSDGIYGACVDAFLLYPAYLDNVPVEDGKTVGKLIQEAAEKNASWIKAQSSEDAQEIQVLRMVDPFEIYKLDGLCQWENCYNDVIDGSEYFGSLHGYSPQIEWEEKDDRKIGTDKLPWEEMPGTAVYDFDVCRPHPHTGEISRAGKCRNFIRDLVKRAKDLGVLTERLSEDGGYEIVRVYWQNDFEINIATFEFKGIEGKDSPFLQAVARNMGLEWENCCRKVILQHGGIYERPTPNCEKAWEHAQTVLRKNIPMLLEVSQMVERVEKLMSALGL